jgi:uncharacterized protein DUF3008
MPAKSGKQQRLMGMALSVKRGQQKAPSKKVAKVAKSMTTKELRKMASKPKKRK